MVSVKPVALLFGILVFVIFCGFFTLSGLLSEYSFGVTGAASGTTNVTVPSVAAISLIVDNVDFGTMAVNDNNDTTDDSPPPFRLRNDGNLDVNVSINATPLWEQDGYNETNQTYQIMCGNTTEWNCTPESITSFQNMPINEPAILIISNLTYQAASDEVEVEVNVTVPPSEIDGNKGSVVTFTASQA